MGAETIPSKRLETSGLFLANPRTSVIQDLTTKDEHCDRYPATVSAVRIVNLFECNVLCESELMRRYRDFHYG